MHGGIPLVEGLFPSAIAESICGLAICPRMQQDRLIWAGTKNGLYSVRSAYHLELDRRTREQSSCSMYHAQSMVWLVIWKLNIRRGAQMFLWRACNEILPTIEKLFSRAIVDDPLCPICGVEVETSAHAIWRCPASSAVWADCGSSIQKMVIPAGEFLACWFD